ATAYQRHPVEFLVDRAVHFSVRYHPACCLLVGPFDNHDWLHGGEVARTAVESTEELKTVFVRCKRHELIIVQRHELYRPQEVKFLECRILHKDCGMGCENDLCLPLAHEEAEVIKHLELKVGMQVEFRLVDEDRHFLSGRRLCFPAHFGEDAS